MNEYSSLINRVNDIIINRNCKINIIDHEYNTYEFYITKQGSSEKICCLTISIVKDIVHISNLRASVHSKKRKSKALETIQRRITTEEVELFKVNSVYTMEKYAGNSFATLLLIYGISTLILRYTHIKHALLFDCGDNSDNAEKNMYHRLGFVPQGHVSLFCPSESEEQSVKYAKRNDKKSLSVSGSSDASPYRLVLTGPEKQADLNSFPQRARDVLSNIETKNIENIVKGKAIIKKVRRKSRKHHIRRYRNNRKTHKK